MGLRFRHSFKLFPGVKLNVGLRGISATFGRPGAHVTLGTRGITGTAGLPGTGLSYTARLTPDAETKDSPTPIQPQIYVPYISTELREINSHGIDSLTSPSLREVHQMIVDAERQRGEVNNNIGTANVEIVRLQKSLGLHSFFLWKFLFPNTIQKITSELEDAKSYLSELQQWLTASEPEIHFEAAPELQRSYDELVRTFNDMCSCNNVWDVTHDRGINNIAERTTAVRAIDRKPVKLRFAETARLKSAGKSMQFDNANGEDLLFYPGVVLMESPDGRFALIDIRDINLSADNRGFIERETVPSDSEVISYSWAYSNKNGSPDRRFNGNYQIPVCLYAHFVFMSKTGLNEEYQLSSPRKAVPFAEAFSRYQQLLSQ